MLVFHHGRGKKGHIMIEVLINPSKIGGNRWGREALVHTLTQHVYNNTPTHPATNTDTRTLRVCLKNARINYNFSKMDLKMPGQFGTRQCQA